MNDLVITAAAKSLYDTVNSNFSTISAFDYLQGKGFSEEEVLDAPVDSELFNRYELIRQIISLEVGIAVFRRLAYFTDEYFTDFEIIRQRLLNEYEAAFKEPFESGNRFH